MTRPNRTVSALAVASSLAFAACHSDPSHDHGAPGAPSALPEGVNAVQNEMRVLHEATRDWVTAVANNDLSKIPASIDAIHAARQLTEQALDKGEYKAPKNGDQLAEFKREDEQFHDQLVELVKASTANDLPGATRHLGTVLDGCTSCHTKYRF